MASLLAFLGVSMLLIAFYLSGDNVSAAKLKLHCIRYLTPGLIALHFGVIVVLAEGWRRLRAHGRSGGRAAGWRSRSWV